MLAFVFLSLPAHAQDAAEDVGRDQPLSRICFGSCNNQNERQTAWNQIIEMQPQLWVWLGDNVYADAKDMDVKRRAYEKLDSYEGYQQLKALCPILATWDDHDYANNDAGSEYEMRAESQQVFLDWLGVPADSPRRQRAGVYHSETFGPAGRRVQIILLDTRYHRSALTRRPEDQRKTRSDGPYAPTISPAVMLGETQWRWLAEKLREPAEVRIIASSIQVLPDEHHWEGWHLMPRERERLYDTIRDAGATGVIFISGDRHHAELTMTHEPGLGYSVYDLTSSSMNKPRGDVDEPNRNRVGDYWGGMNFGVIDIDWEADDPLITLRVRNLRRENVIEKQVPLSRLRPPPLPGEPE